MAAALDLHTGEARGARDPGVRGPRAATRQHRREADRQFRAEQALKQQIRADADDQCAVCGVLALEAHEIRPKSLGGVVSRENTIPVCTPPYGLCHALLQRHEILAENVEPLPGALWPDATRPLFFLMAARIARKVFGDRPLPATVRVAAKG